MGKTGNLINNQIPSCKKIALIIDSKVPKKILVQVKNSIKNFDNLYIKLNTSEKIKNFKIVSELINKLLKKNFHRNDCLIALGGGVLGDIAGLTASLVKRGIKFINIPTTLLSQVDSSIGGKTGVNSKYGKNLIGSFYQPEMVISDISTLNSLPKREVTCGYAEILKHALILDKKLFFWLQKNGKKILNLNNKIVIQKAIYQSCKIKAKVIEADEQCTNNMVDDEATAKSFRHGWYYTGDTATRDADGYIWFVGRADDIISSASYRISPFEEFVDGVAVEVFEAKGKVLDSMFYRFNRSQEIGWLQDERPMHMIHQCLQCIAGMLIASRYVGADGLWSTAQVLRCNHNFFEYLCNQCRWHN